MFADKKSGNDHWTGSRLLENLNYMLDHYVDIVVPKKIETWIIIISVGVYFSIFFGLAIISFYYNQFWINHHLNIAKKCLQPSNSILRGVVREFLGIRQQHWRQRGSPGAGVGYPGSHGYPMVFWVVFSWFFHGFLGGQNLLLPYDWGNNHPPAFSRYRLAPRLLTHKILWLWNQQKFGMTPPNFRVNKPNHQGLNHFLQRYHETEWNKYVCLHSVYIKYIIKPTILYMGLPSNG